jgi:membrane dipeptidase
VRGVARLVPFLLVACGGVAQSSGQTKVDPARVERLLKRAVALDLHDDTTQTMVDEGYDLTQRHDYGQVDVPRMREGHATGVFLSIWTDAVRYTPPEAIRRALEQIDAVRREVARHPADLALATTADQVIAAKKRGQIAILMGVEGGHMIDSDLAVLRTYFDLGARYLTLTHTEHTSWADTSSHPAAHNGLTDFGREVVREMNRLGMMVDISHVSDKTFYDAVETSAAPVIASHSSCRALDDVPRNMTDDMLRALAQNGGVVHINYFEGFLDRGFMDRLGELKDLQARQDAREAEAPKFGDRRQLGPATRAINAERIAKLGRVPLDRLLDHFDHAVKMAGVDHVGLGSDFDGADDQFPAGMEDISKIPNLVRGLMERGYSDEDILKIVGGNTLRVMREVERKSGVEAPRGLKAAPQSLSH